MDFAVAAITCQDYESSVECSVKTEANFDEIQSHVQNVVTVETFNFTQ